MTSSRVIPVFHFLYTCLSQRSCATPRGELDRLCAIFSFYCCGARQQSPGQACCSLKPAPESLGWLGGLGLDKGVCGSDLLWPLPWRYVCSLASWCFVMCWLAAKWTNRRGGVVWLISDQALWKVLNSEKRSFWKAHK